jgi:O-antigen ligase
MKSSFFLPALLFISLIILQTVRIPQGLSGFFFLHNSASELLQSRQTISIYPEATIEELFKVLSYLGLFFLIINNIESRKQILDILNTIIFLGLGISLFGIIQKYTYAIFGKVYWFNDTGSAAAPFGPFANRNNFAGYISMVIPLVIGYLLTDITFSKKIFYLSIALVMSIALLLSFSKGGIIVFLFALLFITLLITFKRSLHSKAVFLGTVFFVIIFFAPLMLGPNLAKKRLLDFIQMHKGLPILGHGYPWYDILRIWLDFPFFGTGLGTFAHIAAGYKTIPTQVKFIYAHNDYLQLLSEVGIIGFGIIFIFFALYFKVLLKMWIQRRDVQVTGLVTGGIAAIWAMLLYSFLDFNLHIPANALLFFIIMALIYRLVFVRSKENNV